jgi:predicted deacetylase
MTKARYLVRFDDICPTMDWDIWERVEAILDEHRVRPILAVVPQNRDPHLEVMLPVRDFWQRVRNWQKKGWTIGLHGYEHRYETRDPGLIGLNRRSEFAGLPRTLQLEKLSKAVEIFRLNGVTADAWVGPAHSFDAVTVDLLLGLGVKIISDGYFLHPVKMLGAIWVPQQLWHFRSLPFGTWTVCYHSNGFSQTDIDALAISLLRFRKQIVSLEDVLFATTVAEPTFTDESFAWGWLTALKSKRALRRLGWRLT